jgi:hypothetical protein
MTYNPDELTDYDKDFEDAPEDEGAPGGEVPPGTYQAYVMSARVVDNDYDGHPQLKLQCKIISGPCKGRVLFPQGSFNPEEVIPTKSGPMAPIVFLKQMVSRLGLKVPITRASEIPGRLDEMLDRVLEVKVMERRGNSEKRNYYVQRFVKKLDPHAPADAPDNPPPHTDDEIPF